MTSLHHAAPGRNRNLELAEQDEAVCTVDYSPGVGPSLQDEADYLAGNLYTADELAEYHEWLDGLEPDEPDDYDGHGSAWGGHPAETW